jgi:hypothetical protein
VAPNTWLRPNSQCSSGSDQRAECSSVYCTIGATCPLDPDYRRWSAGNSESTRLRGMRIAVSVARNLQGVRHFSHVGGIRTGGGEVGHAGSRNRRSSASSRCCRLAHNAGWGCLGGYRALHAVRVHATRGYGNRYRQRRVSSGSRRGRRRYCSLCSGGCHRHHRYRHIGGSGRYGSTGGHVCSHGHRCFRAGYRFRHHRSHKSGHVGGFGHYRRRCRCRWNDGSHERFGGHKRW